MLAWRKVGGSSCRLVPRAAFWLAIAPKAALALPIALESSAPRSETAVPSLLELTRKREKIFSSALRSWAKAPARLKPTPMYLKVSLALPSLPRPAYHCALPSMNCSRPRRTGAGKVLKSWSMSIGVVVEARPSVASPSSGGLLFGPGLIET